MAKKFTFDDAITTDIKGAASNSYIDKLLIENIISKIKGEKTNGKGC